MHGDFTKLRALHIINSLSATQASSLYNNTGICTTMSSTRNIGYRSKEHKAPKIMHTLYPLPRSSTCYVPVHVPIKPSTAKLSTMGAK